MQKDNENKPGACIDSKFIPCEQARAYLAKKGLICNSGDKTAKPEKTKKTRKKKNWFLSLF